MEAASGSAEWRQGRIQPERKGRCREGHTARSTQSGGHDDLAMGGHWNRNLSSCFPLDLCVLFVPHRTDSEVLIFQHVDFKKLPPKAEETESLKSDSLVIPKQTKKTKKRKNTLDVPVASTAGTSGTLLTECAGVESKSCK